MARSKLIALLMLAGVAVGTAGCGSMSASAPPPRLGYAPNDGVLSYGGNDGKRRYTAEGERQQRVASLSDRAPRESFSKAPKGAFDGRDYSQTRLNAADAQQLINTYRASKGLKPLRLNDKLAKAANAHSKDLASHDRISHYGSDGSDPLVRVQRTGYPVHLAAENVGTGQTTLAEVIKGWQDSPGHNENLLLQDAEEMGIALVVDPDTEYKTFWTLVLGAPDRQG
jgi:uncharacterized protein YkwD